jgi:hypothetical protein
MQESYVKGILNCKNTEEAQHKLYGIPAGPPEGGTLALAVKDGKCARW